MSVHHNYSVVTDTHSLSVDDVDGSQLVTVDFVSLGCPADSSHGMHDEIQELFDFLVHVYVGSGDLLGDDF